MPKVPKTTTLQYLLKYLEENVKEEADFLPAVKGFFKLIRHAQIVLNNNFAISLQYLEKEVSEVDFLQSDKHESLLQIDTMILMWMFKHSQSSQNGKFAMSLQYLKKRRQR